LALGQEIVYGKNLGDGVVPIGLLSQDVNDLTGKSNGLIVLNDRPINAETPAHLLNDNLTPNDLFFVRNNGIPPISVDSNSWNLSIDGESVKSTKKFTIQELKEKFDHHTLNITLECGGNGRSEFSPPAKGNQWTTGAIGCAAWTGVKLKDVLHDVGIKENAVYVAYEGKDTHLSGDPNKQSISRGVPIDKALEEESLIAWAMNGEDIPKLNGYPLRLVFGGSPASCSGKWLSRILVRNVIHDGAKMGGQSYRIPCETVSPGQMVEDADMCIIQKMPVKSLITFPKTGASIKLNQTLPIKGHAWTSSEMISSVEYSIDFGMHWNPCDLENGTNRYEWQHFNAKIKFPRKGYYEVWARARDSENNIQPVILPGWNPRGYLNNACHRIAIKVV